MSLMELIKVNSVKLKIILTPKDMEEMDITNETLDYDSVKTRSALRNILEKAKIETGFDTKRDKIYVQVFPSNDGGCEMFLIRRAKLLPEPDENEKTYLRKKYRLTSDSAHERKEYIAVSKNIDDIIELCLRLKYEGFKGISSLYDMNKYFYLVLCFSRKMPSFMKDSFWDDESYRFAFMSDYADLYFADSLTLARLCERGKTIICKDAVEKMAEAFSKT